MSEFRYLHANSNYRRRPSPRPTTAPLPAKMSSARPPNCLGDDDPFPFGKYGPKSDDPRTMKEVPASYLEWLNEQDWIARWPKVQQYILWRARAIAIESEREQRERATKKYGRDE